VYGNDCINVFYKTKQKNEISIYKGGLHQSFFKFKQLESNMSAVTVDDLSARLRSAAYKRWLDKEYKLPKKTKMLNRNTPTSSVNYFNHVLSLGITRFAPEQRSEEAMSCLLFDVSNFPLDQVLNRLTLNGGACVR
jgi:hypothetical protein